MSRIGNSRWPPRCLRSSAFTMIELIACICIGAILVGFLVLPAIINAFQAARQTSDKQTLQVLNEALIRFKCEGGDLNALTAGAPIAHVLDKMRTPTNWCGLVHQFIQSGQTYPASKMQAIGMRQTYQFTKFDTYGADADTTTDILARLDAQGTPADATMQAWVANALATAGTKNFLVLSNPTDKIGMFLSGSGKIEINWGDGSTPVDTTLTGGSVAYTHTYSSVATRAVVLVGNVTRVTSDERAALGDVGSCSFGGDISTMTGLTYLFIKGGNTLTGSVSNLTGLTYVNIQGNNTISGSVTNLTKLTAFDVSGSNTLSGSVTGLTGLTYLSATGNNTLSGSVSNLTGLEYLHISGSNTITGWENAAANASGISGFYQRGSTVLTSTQVNAVLAAFRANKDIAKPYDATTVTRTINLANPGNGAPTGQGITDKAYLQNYMSPNNTGPMVWTVNTN